MRRIRRAVLAGVFLCASFIYAACLDFSTSPDEILYITFERLPFPSVVSGDTLRDSTGVAAVLVATAVNARGDNVVAAPLRYYSIDDTAMVLDVDSVTGVVVADGSKLRNVRLIATLGNLQSPPLLLGVTKSPDSLALTVPLDTISYSVVDTTKNFSDVLTVRVLHNDSTTFYSAVSGWTVRYTLERAADTIFAAIVDEQNRRMNGVPSGLFHIDTTGTDGSAGRKLRIRPGPPLATPLDSVIVLAEVKYRGEHIAGSPGRITVYVKPGT